MQDILVYLFPFADINTKGSLLLVNKELSKLRFKDFIDDDISQHILKHRDYLNIDLYNRIKYNINFIKTYDRNFNIKSNRLNLFKNGLQSIDLTGLINLIYLYFSNNQLQNIDLTGLIYLQELDLSYNRLQNIK